GSAPPPNGAGGLRGFVREWEQASRGIPNKGFPSEWPALELLFTLLSWFPNFQTDPEHQVWLEAITRTIASAGMASPYGMQIHIASDHVARSRESFIRDALLPLAMNEAEVDE